MSVAPSKLPEVKSVYEKNKRSNNIYQIIKLLDKNIKYSSTLEKFREKPDEFLFHPIHCEDLCFLSQKELKDLKKHLNDQGGQLQSMANKFVTLTGASQSLTSFQLEKKRNEKVQKQREIQQKRMEIIQNCPSLAEFYDMYLTKNAKKSTGEIEFESFVNRYPKRFKGYDQFLFLPEKKVIHKNSRFVRFDDVDMGDEVEAAIYNDGGKSAPQKLKKYVNEQMDRIMGDKLNQHNFQLKTEDLLQPTIDISEKKPGKNRNNTNNTHSDSRIDVSLLIERSKILVGDADKNLNFNKLIKNINNYHKYHSKSLLKKPMSPQSNQQVNDYQTHQQSQEQSNKRLTLNKKSLAKSISMTEMNVMEKYRQALQTPLSQAQTEETAPSTDGGILMPAVSKISLILDPKSHENFLNMIVKNQVRLQTQQGPRIETPQSSNSKSTVRRQMNRQQWNRPSSMQFRIQSNSSLLKPFQNHRASLSGSKFSIVVPSPIVI
ncbi:UNKNOWN [Stylonychia lemnae]|uniref:Uncharacterized protein n=1 Tax=Stylonychia lemnae TaxID=5949 RepID=A0A078AH79_STYLE|nr:UNKNOWN [Stylonychia lemnae]|eukprot:CDW81640.1 UNKNOWN [Stylonychia lemnae]